jgi:hypothetical protein
MKKIILIAVLLLSVGCDHKSKKELINENQNLKIQVAILEHKLKIALHANTCWAGNKILTSFSNITVIEKDFKMVGLYNKDTDIYADLRIFSLKGVKDINGKVFKTWVVDELINFEDLERSYRKIPCNEVE